MVRSGISPGYSWTILNLYKAFVRANDIAEKERMAACGYHLEVGLIPPEFRKALATPISRHGIAANRKVLETAARWSHEQGLTLRLVSIEEMFAPQTVAT